MPFRSAGRSWPARTRSISELTFFFQRLIICVVMPAKDTPDRHCFVRGTEDLGVEVVNERRQLAIRQGLEFNDRVLHPTVVADTMAGHSPGHRPISVNLSRLSSGWQPAREQIVT
jgi:hypothetical protein